MWFLALFACSGPRSPVQSAGVLAFDGPRPRNLLMISIDTLRRDHVGRYGATGLTPFLDELADQGVALDDFHQCANWTFPSVTCTLGGRDAVDLGFLPRLDAATRGPIPAGTPFLATWLAEAGLEGWLFSINTWLSAQWGTSQGYAHETWPGIFHTTEIARRAFDDLDASIAAGATDRWFVHLHVKEPHAPYRPPWSYFDEVAGLDPLPWDLDEFDVHYDVTRDLWPTMDPAMQALVAQHLRIRYEGEVRWLDDELREVFDDLEARGRLDDTLVVIWTDHGEQFWEHGAQTHAYGLYAEETDAVALFWAKNLRPLAWTQPVSSIDLAPTLLDVFGVPRPREVTGRIVGTAPADRPRYAHTLGREGPVDAIRRDDLELVFHWDGRLEAFDRLNDPGEFTDRWDPADPDQAELWDLLRARVLDENALAPDLPVIWP